MISPYETTARVLSEPSNLCDDLVIIAGETGRLHGAQRAVIRHAADELLEAQNALVSLGLRLRKTMAQLIAANEQLLEMRRREQTHYPVKLWQMSCCFDGQLTEQYGVINAKPHP
jgi:hypothetical protein